MKSKIQKLLLCLGFLAAISACDMIFVDDPVPDGGRELSENERDELEKTGRFLKLVNLPRNTQVANVSSVSVANSSSVVGMLNKDNTILIFRDAESCTVYLPLVYSNGGEFLETGFFYTAFAVHVDALTKYIVDISDHFVIPFSDGRGQADVNNLPASVFLDPAVSRELNVKERDELEITGRFLKLVNMPLNTQMPNVFSVSVANSSSTVGKLNKNIPTSVYRDSNTCTVYIPLVYNDENEFLETGYFYTAFSIHVDALTKYIVSISDHFIVSFTDGRGLADVNNIPASPVAELRCLTVFNLPASVSVHNFNKVSVRNQAGEVASCKDYSQILLSVDGDKATAKIPLHYTSLNQIFTETGVFFVLFDINIDAETRFTLTLDDKVKVSFINGNGYLDILNIPDNPVPYLTIKGLPLNATKQHVSNVNVYNRAGSVAACADYKNVAVSKDIEFSTFLIPLSSSSDTGYFHNSGRFAVSFTFNVDIDTQIIYTQSDDLILPFTDGSAEIDLTTFFGFFEASLTNINDSSRPVIKAGSSFDVNGHRCTVSGNYTVTALTPSSSCLMYLYAYYAEPDFFYEFSSTIPSYNPKRKGWYNGSRRALWKMIYLNSSAQFLFKTSMKDNEDAFPQFGTAVLNDSDYSYLIASKPVSKSINGGGNPDSETVTLDPGVYVIELKGAGGGNGSMNGGTGGSGGLIREIITLNSKTSFTAFTGSSGNHAPDTSASGTFNIVTTKNYYTYTTTIPEPGHSITTGHTLHNSDTVLDIVTLYPADPTAGGSGGGGGSGTFLYSMDKNYLLVAGGAGGGSGGSAITPGGAGGAGGTVGPGAGGGGSGRLSQTNNIGTGDWSSTGSAGGSGGGFRGGSAGSVAANGGNGYNIFDANSSILGGTGTPSYTASDFLSVSSSIPFLRFTPDNTIDGRGNASSGAVSSLSSAPVVTIRTSFSISGNSGSGGSAAAFSYITDVGGKGASSPAISSASRTGTFTPNGNYDLYSETGTSSSASGSAKNHGPGVIGSQWNTDDPKFNTNLTLRIGSTRNGLTGSNGGNNRNSTKGGGAAPGAAGTITIYKIY